MKFVITIVQAYDCDRLLRALTGAGFGATKISSVGGFLRMANCTIMMGMEDEQLQEAIRIIESVAKRRVEVKMDTSEAEYSEWVSAGFHEVQIGGSIVFVLPLQEIYRIHPDYIERKTKTPA